MPELERIPPGRLIADRYRVGERIGHGSMGIVYAGEHVRVGRQVAIKVLTHEWSSKSEVRMRFEAEARAASAAGHPNVIQVLDAGELADGRLYIVMEFVAGRDLHTLLWSEPALAPARVCRLARDVAFGLRAAHAQGVIHRDLKLENVMVQALPEGENVKVLDFGVAAGVVTQERESNMATVMGTPEYMAPEQVDNAEPSASFDIYALGVMMFELLTKELPVSASHPLQLMALKQHVPAPRAADSRPEIGAALDQLIADCLAIDPRERPSSCDAFLERLTPILAALEAQPVRRATVVSDPRQPPPRLTRAYVDRERIPTPLGSSVRVAGRARRSPWPLVVGGAIAVLSLVAVAFAVLRDPDPGAGSQALAVERDDAPPVRETGAAVEPSNLAVPVEPVEPVDPMAPVAADTAEVVATTALQESPLGESATDTGEQVLQAPPTLTSNSEDPSTTPRCVRVRADAVDDRRTHDWEGVLAATRSRDCWSRSRDRQKLETQAYMELQRFEDCLRAGKHLTDTESRKWVTICNKRSGG